MMKMLNKYLLEVKKIYLKNRIKEVARLTNEEAEEVVSSVTDFSKNYTIIACSTKKSYEKVEKGPFTLVFLLKK